MPFNQRAQLSALPNIQDVTRGLQSAISDYGNRARQKRQDYSQALKDYAPIAEQQTIAGVLKDTKADLDEESLTRINAEYVKNTQNLDKTYMDSIANLDTMSKYAEGNALVQYDDLGNAIPYYETPKAKKFRDAQQAHNEKYKEYNARLDAEMMLANRTANAEYEAGYDPTKLKSRMTEALAQKGVALDRADLASSLAAKPYMAKALTEQQKLVMESKSKGIQSVLESDLERINEMSKGNLKTTAIGGGVKGSTSRRKGGLKSPSYEELELANSRIDKEFDDRGYGLWKDNTAIKNDIMGPLFLEFGTTLSAAEITDVIVANKDEGWWKNTLKDSTTLETLRAQLKDKEAKIISNGSAGDFVTTGEAAIDNKTYNKLRQGAMDRFNVSNTQLQAAFGGKGNKTTAHRNLQASLKRYSEIGLDVPKKDKPGSTETKSIFSGDSKLAKAMRSPKKGLVATTFSNNPTEFIKTYKDMSTEKQGRIAKVLGIDPLDLIERVLSAQDNVKGAGIEEYLNKPEISKHKKIQQGNGYNPQGSKPIVETSNEAKARSTLVKHREQNAIDKYNAEFSQRISQKLKVKNTNDKRRLEEAKTDFIKFKNIYGSNETNIRHSMKKAGYPDEWIAAILSEEFENSDKYKADMLENAFRGNRIGNMINNK